MGRTVALRHLGVMATILLASCASGGGGDAPRSGGGGGGSGRYKVGNPYTVNGIRYTPAVDYDYDRTGVASWYGPGFHGASTANGERYNQDDMTAAHTTLPLPSLVEVTNLETGRKAIVRVNDRGPFVDDRIIDLSRAAAEELGVTRKGTAKVRVRVLEKESRMYAAGQDPLAGGAIARYENPPQRQQTRNANPSVGPIPGSVLAASRPPIQTVQSVEPVTSAPLASPTQSGLRPDEMGLPPGTPAGAPPTRLDSPAPATAGGYRSGYGTPYGSAPGTATGSVPRTISNAPGGYGGGAAPSYNTPVTAAPLPAPTPVPQPAAPAASGQGNMVWQTGPSGHPIGDDAAPRPQAVPQASEPMGTEISVAPPAAAANPAAAAPAGSDVFIQVGAFSNQANAQALAQSLGSYGAGDVSPVEVNGKTLYRVRLGPYSNGAATDALLDEIRYMGHPTAKLVRP